MGKWRKGNQAKKFVKTNIRNLFRFVSAGLGLALSLLAYNARATVYYWDPEGAVSAPTTTQLTGTWATTGSDWSASSSGGSQTTWPTGDAACFCSGTTAPSGSFTVTVSGTVSCAGIYNGPLTPPAFNLVLGGTGTISLVSGDDAFAVGGSDGYGTVINCVIGGAGILDYQDTYGYSAGFALNGANTYSGGTYINTGNALTFGNSTAFGTGTITWKVAGFIAPSVSTALNVANPMTHFAGTETFAGNSGGLTFSGNWTLPSSGTVTIANFDDLGSYGITVSGVISGPAALTINTSTTGYNQPWTFTGLNTFSGALTITKGTLTIGGSGDLGNSGGTGSYSPNIANGGTFTYSSSATQTLSGIISSTGTLNLTAGKLILSGANTYSGTTTLSGGTLQLNHSDTPGTSGPLGSGNTAGSIVLTGGTLQYASANGGHDYSPRFSTASSQKYNVDLNGQTVTFGTALTSSSGSLSVIDSASSLASELTLTGVNTYSGGTTVTGTCLGVTADSGLGGTSGALTLNGGTLKNNNSAPTIGSTRTITLGANGGYFDAGWSMLSTINAQITGSGLLGINQDGGSYVVLGNTGNNYTGNTIIGTNGPGYYSAGTLAGLQLGASGVIPNGSGYGNVYIYGNYDGQLNLAGFTQTINGLIGSGTVNNTTGNGSLSVGNNNATSTFSGVIENTGGTLALTKVGTGSLTLSGANTYSGATTVSAGTLALGSSGTISDTPSISIAAGATYDVSAISSYTLSSSTSLSASGTSSAATIKGGTTVSLGSRPITLTYDGSHPALSISQGTLSLNGNAFTVNKSGGLAAGTYTIVQQASGNISSSGSYSVTGTAIGSGNTGSISVSGGNVNLVIMENTTTSLSRTTGSSTQTYGSTLTFTATVTGNGTTPTGSVIFKDGASTLATVALSSGTAAYTSYTDLNVSGSPHSIAAYYQGDSTHNTSDSSASPISQSITAKALTVSGITAASTSYDGTTTAKLGGTAAFQTAEAPGSGSTSDGKPYTVDSVSAGGTAAGTLAAKDVGTEAVTITGVTVTGTGSGNYTVTQQTGLTQNVTAKALTAQGTLSIANKIYDGTTNASPSGAAALQTAESVGTGSTSDGIPYTGDDVSLTGTPSYGYNSPDVGTATTVSESGLSLTGGQAGDYSLTAPTLSASITNAFATNIVTVSPNPALPGALVTFTSTLSTLSPATVVPTNSVQFLMDGVVFGSPVFPTDGVAMTSSSTLSHGYHTNEADYAGDTNALGATNIVGSTNTVVVLINTPPTATNFVVGTVMNTAVSFTETQLLRSASDADGDTVTLSALDSTSTNGATVTDVSGTITYTPMTGFVGADAFGYTVSDTYGATATNVVNVVVRAGNYSSTLTDLTTQEDGTMQFNASGLPGYTYGVQATTSLDSPDWETIGSAMAGDNGLIQYDDEDSTNYTTRYYRLVYPYTP